MNSLSLRFRRPPYHFSGFLDFVVDGVSLYDSFCSRIDAVSCLLWHDGDRESLQKAVDQILLLSPTDLPDNYHCLYVCSHCGGVECGGITCKVEASGETIIWSEFSETNDLTAVFSSRPIPDVGPFSFDRVQYSEAIRGSLLEVFERDYP